MQKHIQLLGMIYIFFNAIVLILGSALWLLVTSYGMLAGDPQAAGFFAFAATVMAALFLILSLPGILCGIGILKGWWWARYLGFVLALFSLLNAPLGTLLAVYTVWVLIQDETIAYFEADQDVSFPASPAP